MSVESLCKLFPKLIPFKDHYRLAPILISLCSFHPVPLKKMHGYQCISLHLLSSNHCLETSIVCNIKKMYEEFFLCVMYDSYASPIVCKPLTLNNPLLGFVYNMRRNLFPCKRLTKGKLDRRHPERSGLDYAGSNYSENP